MKTWIGVKPFKPIPFVSDSSLCLTLLFLPSPSDCKVKVVHKTYAIFQTFSVLYFLFHVLFLQYFSLSHLGGNLWILRKCVFVHPNFIFFFNRSKQFRHTLPPSAAGKSSNLTISIWLLTHCLWAQH